jgi:hypothetical protein
MLSIYRPRFSQMKSLIFFKREKFVELEMAFEELGHLKGQKLLNLFIGRKLDPIKYRGFS